MRAGGIDIGSRYIKYVLLEDGRLASFQKRETGHMPLAACDELIRGDRPDNLIATGYGRYLLEVHGSIGTITEIKAVARGAIEVFPDCRTIIDIGGQDTKVISLNDNGTVGAFEMNDRCAAGTGKFLEVMAHALGYSAEDFGADCGHENGGVKINSLCTVFAESEVVSLIARGERREVISDAVHNSIVNRVFSLVKRIGVRGDIVFAGGCARNPGLVKIFEDRLGRCMLIHEHPDLLCALGAALYASDNGYVS